MKQLMIITVVTIMAMPAIASLSPMSGDFDIVIDTETPGMTFSPIPWVSPAGSEVAWVWPYATDDYTEGYSGAGAGYNLASAMFQSGTINVSDGIARSGDLAIRIGNYAGQEVTFGATVLTLDLKDQGAFDVYLPEFTFKGMDNIHFWVANDGSTYFANTSMQPGAPNMSAAEAIAAGDQYLAMIPEPATLSILGLGGLTLLGRKRR